MGALDLTSRLKMDGKGFNAGAKKAESRAQQMRAKIGSAFSGMAGGLAAAVGGAVLVAKSKETADWAARVRDLGVQFGVSTGFVQKLDYAFKQTGGDSETAFKAIRKMMLATGKLQNSLTSKMTREMLADAFNELGVSMKDLESMSPEQMFAKIAKQLKNADGASASLQDALNLIFGKGGTQLLVTFGSDLEAMSKDFEEMGGVVDDATIQKLGAAADKLEELGSRSKPILADISMGFLKAGEVAMNAFHGAINSFENLAESYYRWKNDVAGDPVEPIDSAAAAQAETFNANASLLEEFGTDQQAQDYYDESGNNDPSEEKKRQQELAAAARKRKEEAEELAALQDAAERRALDRLPIEEKILALQKKIAEEKQRQLEIEEQQRASGAGAADAARREVDAAKERMAEVTAAHGDVSEVAAAAAELEEMKRRQAALEKAAGHKEFAESDRAGVAEYGAKLEGAKRRVGDMVAAGPKGADFGSLKKSYDLAGKLRDEADKAEAAGDMNRAKELRADADQRLAAAKETAAASGMDAEKVREFFRALQAARDAQLEFNKASAPDQKSWVAAADKLNAAQMENQKRMQQQQARLNALREKYGDDAVNDAQAAMMQVTNAEAKLEQQFAKLQQEQAKAMSDIAQLEAGTHFEFQVDMPALKKELDMLNQMAASGDPEMVAKRDRMQAKYDRAEARRMELLEQARQRATQAGNQMQVITAGNQQAQIDQLRSQEKEEALQAERDKLQEQKKKEEEKKKAKMQTADKRAQALAAAGQVDAAAFKADSLARIGGLIGGRNPVLDLQKRQYMLEKEHADSSAKAARALEHLAGTTF